jgi:hypothetical protein
MSSSEKYLLAGLDGNDFNIVVNSVSHAMRECGKPWAEIDAYSKDAKSADYDHLLAVSTAMIDRLNAGS